jgi:hypothetical protein
MAQLSHVDRLLEAAAMRQCLVGNGESLEMLTVRMHALSPASPPTTQVLVGTSLPLARTCLGHFKFDANGGAH